MMLNLGSIHLNATSIFGIPYSLIKTSGSQQLQGSYNKRNETAKLEVFEEVNGGYVLRTLNFKVTGKITGSTMIGKIIKNKCPEKQKQRGGCFVQESTAILYGYMTDDYTESW